MAEQIPAEPEAPVECLRFLMRSGNSFILDGVTDWGVETRAGRITKLRLTQMTSTRFHRLIIDTIDLTQIEAIVLAPPVTHPADRAALTREEEQP